MSRPSSHRLALGPRKTLPDLDTSLGLRLGKGRPHWVGAGGHPQTPPTPDAAPAATSVHPLLESPVAQASCRSRALLSALPPRLPLPSALRPTSLFTSHPLYRLSYLSRPTPPRKLPPGLWPHALFSPRTLPCVAHRALAPSPRPLPFSSSLLCALFRPTCVPQTGEEQGCLARRNKGGAMGRRAQFFPGISQTSCAQAGRFPEILQVTGRFSKDVFHGGECETRENVPGTVGGRGIGLESIDSALVPGGRGTRVGVEFVRARKLSNRRILVQYLKNSKLMSTSSG